MMNDSFVLTERDGATLILTLNYPGRRNALSMPLRTALIDALESAESDDKVRAIVVTGAGGTFCAGGDISGMNVKDLAQGRERFRITHRLVRLMVHCSKPIVAAVEGHAVGAGLSLALCCDTVVASQQARFGAGFGRIGLIADMGLNHTLPARIGMGRARQVLLYGEQMDAQTAERIGIVDHLTPPGGTLQLALPLARTFHNAAPLPVALTKALLAEGLDAALERERDMQSSLFLTPEHAEGRDAFLAKREPDFRGS
ncbi:MAG: enoyl-CoA hydratase/isomerase family protein [Acetobacteraceae bacterium]|nr:enoyl-CoA hydratase/isomerase family protein [Acetobacteraceae bacterium]